MPTQKIVEIQNNKILTVNVSKQGFKPITKSVIVSQNQDLNITMIPSESANNVFTLGDRLFGISTFFTYFTPSGQYDTTSLKFVSAKQTTGNSLSEVAVAKTQWLSYVEATLSIATTQGTSNSFVFTYNGSTWDLTGATTISGISATDLQDNFGITFTGTPTENDVITITETYYNKFACFVLDSNYRNTSYMRTDWWDILTGLPDYSTAVLAYAAGESGSFTANYLLSNFGNNYPIPVYNKNIGTFIINNFTIYPVAPNLRELKDMYDNRVALDTYDMGTGNLKLSNWGDPTNAFEHWQWHTWSCTCKSNAVNDSPRKSHWWSINSSGGAKETHIKWDNGWTIAANYPIFELPCM